MRIPDLVCSVNQALERSAEVQLKPHSLTIEQFRVLTALNESNGISMGALATRVCMDSPTLTKLIDRMVASADVYRGPDPRDRRKVLVFISNKGLTTYEALSDIHDQLGDTLSGALGPQKLEMLESLLTQALQAISGADDQYPTPVQPGPASASKTHRLS